MLSTVWAKRLLYNGLQNTEQTAGHAAETIQVTLDYFFGGTV